MVSEYLWNLQQEEIEHIIISIITNIIHTNEKILLSSLGKEIKKTFNKKNIILKKKNKKRNVNTYIKENYKGILYFIKTYISDVYLDYPYIISKNE